MIAGAFYLDNGNGRMKMVGKSFIDEDRWVFLHEESGSQWLNKYQSPGGVDWLLVAHLEATSVPEFFHYSKKKNKTYHTTIERLKERSDAVVLDGRSRFVMNAKHWEIIDGHPFRKVPRLPQIILPWEDRCPSCVRIQQGSEGKAVHEVVESLVPQPVPEGQIYE